MDLALRSESNKARLLHRSNRLYWRSIAGRMNRDLRARDLRPERVFDPHRNAYFHRRTDSFRMNDFRTVVGKFNGFGKGDFGKCSCLRTDTRIGGQHTVDIRPDPNLVGAESS